LVNRNGIPKSSAHLLVNHQAQYEQIVKPGNWDGEYKSPDSGNKIFYDLLFIQRLLTKLFTPGSSKRAELSSRISQFKKVLLGFSINIHITVQKEKWVLIWSGSRNYRIEIMSIPLIITSINL
jgi:hypothetical protein